VRAQRGSSPGFSGGTVAPEKKRERKKRALTCGPRRQREREGRERAADGAEPADGLACGPRGKGKRGGCWASVAHAGVRGGKGPEGGKRERSGPG
jgi:hypothetical protein